MHVSHVALLTCPLDKSPLRLSQNSIVEDGFVRTGELVSNSGARYKIRNFIPRFVEHDSYAESFSVEWEKHPDILRDATSSYSGYRQRFFSETKWNSRLDGDLILEAGCGPGAMTTIALETGATVVSCDLSGSVEQASRVIGRNQRSLIVQANIFDLPFMSETFDKAFCFGVLQHTPDPNKAMRKLAESLKPRGLLAADSYIMPNRTGDGGHAILRAKYRFRKLLPRLSPRSLHTVVKAYVSFVFPIYRLVRDLKPGMRLMHSLMIDDYRTRMPNMQESYYKEFSVLDIFDFLSPVYDLPQTEASFRQMFSDAGLTEVDVHPGWNGIEGRGQKPGIAALAPPHDPLGH